jgi:hypothetical protein
MRALTRMRTLAAACALLLFVTGMAAANLHDRQIDRSGTPEPKPPMVGDPDQPTGNIVAIYGYWFVVFHIPTSWMPALPASQQTYVMRLGRGSKPISRAGHAR